MKLGGLKDRFKHADASVAPDSVSSPAKKRPFKSTRGNKFVLFIGDEGAILVYIRGNVVHSRQFVPDASAQNLEELKSNLAADTKAPMLVIIDSMDQSYVQQTLPPVSSLSVNKLVKRRLERDFGANDIKGAIVLGREKTGRKDWNFLMVSLEKSPQLSVWLNFVSELPNRFQGIYLVSAETEVMVENLEKAMGVYKKEGGSEWKFFVSHNKVGGFRQVILRNRRLMFTRMAQPVSESDPEVIAGNIEQEMLSTIEYMRRLSFDAASGLDVYIIVSGAIKKVIDVAKFQATSMNIMTPYEVAQHLDIEGATQPTDQFGDVILAAGIGCSPRHVLTLATPEMSSFASLYKISQFQRLGGALAALGILIYAGSVAYDVYASYSDISKLQDKKAEEQKSLDALRQEIKHSSIDVEKSSDLIELYQQMQHDKLSPIPFIMEIEKVIKPPIVVKQLEWSLDEKAASGPVPKMVGVFTLEFPGVNNADALKVVLKKVLEDVKTALKGYDVAYTRLPEQLNNEKTDMTFDNQQTNQPPPDSFNNSSDVQLTIKGDIMKETAAKPGA